MSISRSQQIMIKRAQREASLPDDEYRDALEAVCGLRSTTNPRMTDRDVDLVMAYLEAIYFRKVDAGELKPTCKPDAMFRQRKYWASKNPKAQTSRDRFCETVVEQEIAELEKAMADIGFGQAYCDGIKARATHGRDNADSLFKYKAALARTLKSKSRRAVKDFSVTEPF